MEIHLKKKGYLSAQCEYDSFQKQIKCEKGPLYLIHSIFLDTLKRDTILPFTPTDVQSLLNTLLLEQQQKGKFFFSLDTIRYEFVPIHDTLVSVLLFCKTGHERFVYIDSILSKEENIPSFYLRYLGMKKKRLLLTPTLLEKTRKRIEQSPYYQLGSDFQIIVHSDTSAWLLIPLKRKSTNSIDGILGVIPPQSNTPRWMITASLRFSLLNLFNIGEAIHLNYERLPNTTQRFLLQFQLPYLLPIGIQGQFDLFKQDTSFLNRNLQIGISYPVSEELHLFTLMDWRNSNVINTIPYRTIKWPPPRMLDMRKRLYGIGFQLHPYFQSFNPVKGWTLSSDYRTGFKWILKNPGFDSLDYTRIPLKQFVHEGHLTANAFFPVKSPWLILATRIQGYVLSTPFYFENELQQIGGAKTLRGFRERQFFSSAYLILTVEPRLRLDSDTYLGLFSEGGLLQYRFLNTESQLSYPYSTGITLGLKTKNGVLTLSYGIGTIYPQPLNPLRGQVHFQLNTFF